MDIEVMERVGRCMDLAPECRDRPRGRRPEIRRRPGRTGWSTRPGTGSRSPSAGRDWPPRRLTNSNHRKKYMKYCHELIIDQIVYENNSHSI